MPEQVTRRTFLERSAAGAAAAAFLPAGAPGAWPAPQRKLSKAVKYGMVRVKASVREKFELLVELGFDGVELPGPSRLDPDEVLKARDATGLPIHGVVDSVHWRQPLSDPDAEVRAKGRDGLRRALADAERYGATTVLLVPAVVSKRVDYAAAYRRSQAEIREVLPEAEERGVAIALENVWNNFLLSPLEFARYIDELESPRVGAYFDVGNVVKFGWPEHWIRALGERILKLDVKEYSREKGFGVELMEGDCDWPAVMKELDAIGYEGWCTAEVAGGGRDRLREIAARMDRIFALGSR